MILNKLILLRDILTERLPFIDRWDKVDIYFHGDRIQPDTISDFPTRPGYFYILWSSPKRSGSPNQYEHKEVSLDIDNLDAIIKRQREKLRTVSERS